MLNSSASVAHFHGEYGLFPEWPLSDLFEIDPEDPKSCRDLKTGFDPLPFLSPLHGDSADSENTTG